jgi:MFS family permease
LLLALGLASFLIALTQADQWGWSSTRTLGLFTLSVAALVTWWQVESRMTEPLIDTRTMRRRVIALTNVTALGSGFASFSAWVIVPLFVQNPSGLSPVLAARADYGFSASATETGLYLVPASLMSFTAGPIAAILGRRYGAARPLSFGIVEMTVGLAALALFHDAPWQVILAMVLIGSGMALAFAAMATLVIQGVDAGETGVTSGVNVVVRAIGSVIGGQFAAAILAAQTIPGSSVPKESAYTHAFWCSAAVGLITAIVSFTIRPRSARRLMTVRSAYGRG